MVGFPVSKLGYLLVKQVSKPFSKTLADRAKTSPVFRSYVIFPLGRVLHRVQAKFKMLELGVPGKVTKHPKIGDDKLTQLGSEVLAEILFFAMVSSFLVVAVYLISEDDESGRDEEELVEMGMRLDELDKMVEIQQEVVDTMETRINYLKTYLEDEEDE